MENVRVGRVWEKIRPDLDFECEQRKEVILFYVKHTPKINIFSFSNRLIFFLDCIGQIASKDHSNKLNIIKIRKFCHFWTANNVTWSNPMPIPTPPTTPTLSWIFVAKISKQPPVWIFMAASVSDRSRTPLPQLTMEDRQQESGTSCWLEKVTLFQSWYSWAPQQSN